MKTGRKISGGKYVARRKKKKFELPGQRRVIKLGENKRKTKRTKGGNKKVLTLRANTVNVMKSGKSSKVQIKNVLETPSNKFLARQNVLTKGTIVQTDLGKVKITNRPTQEGVVNGILVE